MKKWFFLLSMTMDILGNQDMPLNEGVVPTRIPMGSVRIVDLIKE